MNPKTREIRERDPRRALRADIATHLMFFLLADEEMAGPFGWYGWAAWLSRAAVAFGAPPAVVRREIGYFQLNVERRLEDYRRAMGEWIRSERAMPPDWYPEDDVAKGAYSLKVALIDGRGRGLPSPAVPPRRRRRSSARPASTETGRP